MLQAGLPVGVGMNQVEFVASAEVFVFVFVAQYVVAMQYGSLVYQISASLVQSHRIGGGQDAKVGDDGGVNDSALRPIINGPAVCSCDTSSFCLPAGVSVCCVCSVPWMPHRRCALFGGWCGCHGIDAGDEFSLALGIGGREVAGCHLVKPCAEAVCGFGVAVMEECQGIEQAHRRELPR